MKVRVLFTSLFLCGSLLLPQFVRACACCAEPGTYILRYTRPDAYIREVLKALNAEGPAQLYYAAGGDDDIKGLAPHDAYQVQYGFSNGKWTLSFTDDKGSKGHLYFTLPARMQQYKVDQHENGSDTPGYMIVLYKEWRFEGSITGDGIFAAGLPKPAKFFFVLQGRGNLCDEPDQFSHWRLEVKGTAADYAFFGKLRH